ncbi:MAG TPA: trigger factor, partial [Gammaproteobacteria bacterium]|nr:trigger factor [Gammaproteobacteria bacterium]
MNAATSNAVDVSVEARAGLERSVTVRVPKDEIEQQVTQRLAKVAKTARLKGFRPGKVPAKVVRQHYGSQVRQEVMSDVIRSSLARALAQEKLQAAGGPSIELLGDGSGGHFAYRATFEVYPKVELRPLAELSFEVPEVEIGESDVDEVIEKLREQRADLELVDRKSQADDRITIDFKGTMDGEPFEGGEGEDVSIFVGTGQVIDDFDAALVGLAPGETKVADVKFPDDYPVAELAGKKAVFEITAKRVEQKVLPVVDEAFAEKFGVTEGGVEGLRKEVRANMERELEARRKTIMRRHALDSLVAAHSIPVPKALVEDEITMLQRSTMQQMRISDEAKAPPREEFRESAQRRIAMALLVQELIRTRDLHID